MLGYRHAATGKLVSVPYKLSRYENDPEWESFDDDENAADSSVATPAGGSGTVPPAGSPPETTESDDSAVDAPASLDGLSKADLVTMAKESGLTGVAKLNKADLIAAIRQG